MLRYQGAECPVCNKIFVKDDDIVVCPICGAPHHRSCYKEIGGCALEAQHAQGKEWRRNPEPEKTSGQSNRAVVQCTSCGGVNPPNGIFCQICGSRLGAARPNGPDYQGDGFPFQPQFSVFASPYGGLNPEDELDGITIKEYATYIGSASYHYLPRFKMLAQNSKFVTFNWSAFFFGIFYFLYRKMSKAAVVLGILFALTLVPSLYYSFEYLKEVFMQYGGLIFPLPAITTPLLERILMAAKAMQAVQFALSVGAGFMANRLYLQSAERRIKKIRAQHQGADTRIYIEKLAHAGGVSVTYVALGVVCVVVGYLLVSYLLGLVLLS